MSRLPTNPSLFNKEPAQLVRQLDALFRSVAVQLNQLSEGQLVAKYNAMTSVPTTGTWAQGDFVANSAPTEAGAAASKYVIEGWVCTVAGTPGTWVQKRFLTGN